MGTKRKEFMVGGKRGRCRGFEYEIVGDSSHMHGSESVEGLLRKKERAEQLVVGSQRITD